MTAAVKLTVFALGLVLVFLAALGAGAVLRNDDAGTPPADHGGHPVTPVTR